MRKLTAEIVPYSSIVGGGLVLHDERGRAAFIVNIIGTTEGVTKAENNEISKQLAELVNEQGLQVSPR